jgi:periplasmic divalent cation tolerance protein
MAGESKDGEAVLILVTAGGRDDAERLGEGLVVERIAASCSVVPMVHSFYYENDVLKREHESLLIVKTVRSRAKAAVEYLRTHHSYEVPEILEVAIDGGPPAYLKWLSDQVAETPSDP